MQFSVVKGIKTTAKPKMKGLCPFCDAEVISKCGTKNIWHWAHKGKLECDPWWENETEWHRNWKSNFPKDLQEVIHYAITGEKHIADVKTGQGWVIEFQNSPISPDERKSRDNFYQKIVWVINGKRRQKDSQQFFKALENGKQLSATPAVFSVHSDDCKLFDEWSGGSKPVFFDFGEEDRIWLFYPNYFNGRCCVLAFSRKYFIELHLGDEVHAQHFIKSLNDFDNFLRAYFVPPQVQVRRPQTIRLPTIPRYYRRRRSRRPL